MRFLPRISRSSGHEAHRTEDEVLACGEFSRQGYEEEDVSE
jgi:hypothetical protein